MTSKSWIFFFSTLAIFTFWGNVGDAIFISAADGVTMNNSTAWNDDQISQGGGLVGSMRVVIGFFTTTLPNWATFNYNFLQDGNLQIVRWALVTIFGGSFVIMLSMSFIGILRRNF